MSKNQPEVDMRSRKGLCMVRVKRVKPRVGVDALSELCSPLLKGGNSAFIAVIASGLFFKYQSLG